jgi:NADPH:quinone reductase-like Zn-dependent oxidoreductase
MPSPSLNKYLVQSLDGNAVGNGAVLGCDFTGIVEKLGDKITTVKVGDRIAGLIWGGKKTLATSLVSSELNLLTSPF